MAIASSFMATFPTRVSRVASLLRVAVVVLMAASWGVSGVPGSQGRVPSERCARLDSRPRPLRIRYRAKQPSPGIDVAPRSPGVRARLAGEVHQGVGDIALQAGDADNEAGLDEGVAPALHRSTSASIARTLGSVMSSLAASRRMASMKQVDHAAANSCSGSVPVSRPPVVCALAVYSTLRAVMPHPLSLRPGELRRTLRNEREGMSVGRRSSERHRHSRAGSQRRQRPDHDRTMTT